MTLKSITGYANIDDRFGFDLAGGGFMDIPGATGLLVASDANLDQVSQEFQLLGKLGSSLDWQLGLFYLNEDGSQSYAGTQGISLFAENSNTETNSYAAYGEGTYHLSDALSVTGGLRWTKDEKDYDISCTGIICQGTAQDLSDDWSETTGKLSVNYQLNENQMVYLSAVFGSCAMTNAS